MATQFSGGTIVNTTFTGANRQDILQYLSTALITAGWTSQPYMGGGIGIVGNFTITIASPGVVTYAGHGLSANDVVVLQTTGALPTGLAVNTRYFVRNPTANTFELSATSGGASINTTGSQSGTHRLNSESILLESATQASVTNPVRVRIKDNRITCAVVTIENTAGTLAGTSSSTFGGYILPGAAKTYQVIATRYHFLCFTPGVSSAREFVMAGMLYVPTLLSPVSDHGYVLGNGQADGTLTTNSSIRTSLNLVGSTGNMQFMWGANLFEVGNASNQNFNGYPQFLITNAAASRGLRYSNDALLAVDLMLTAGLNAVGDEGKIKGQFFDMVVIGAPFAIDTLDTFSGHNWQNITNNNTTGCVWVAIT